MLKPRDYCLFLLAVREDYNRITSEKTEKRTLNGEENHLNHAKENKKMAKLDTNVDVETQAETSETGTEAADNAAEIARLKAALDRAMKEAAENKRALRARQTAEEAAAEEAKARQQEMQEQLNQLLKEKSIAATTVKLQSFVTDTEMSAKLAEHLYGAEDIDAAVKLFGKAWEARENALKREYGKIPAPGAGSTEGAIVTKEQLDMMSGKERVRFYNEHPDEYNELMDAIRKERMK